MLNFGYVYVHKGYSLCVEYILRCLFVLFPIDTCQGGYVLTLLVGAYFLPCLRRSFLLLLSL